MGVEPYREVTLRDYCRIDEQPFNQVAAHFVVDRLQRPIPSLSTDKVNLLRLESPDIFVGRVQEARLLGKLGFVCTKNGYVIRKQLAAGDERSEHDLASYFVGQDAVGRSLISLPDDQARIEQECLFVGGEVNFGHLLIEALTRLAVVSWFPPVKHLPIVVYDDMPQRFLDFMDLLGFGRDRRISIPRFSSPTFAKLWFISPPYYRPRPTARPQISVAALWSLRAAVAYLNRPFGPKRPRLFLLRGKTKWRRLINETAISQQVATLGIESIQLDQFSAAEQIAAVSNAHLIITPQGASSQITQFAPSDCIVIELTTPGTAFVFGPLGTSTVLDQPFARVIGRTATDAEVQAAGLPVNPSTKNLDADFLVPVETLMPMVATALAAIDNPQR